MELESGVFCAWDGGGRGGGGREREREMGREGEREWAGEGWVGGVNESRFFVILAERL